jgi:Na+-transporting methylmalonyl-CoA/oxaloacetate decarboxylase gamma subunit
MEQGLVLMIVGMGTVFGFLVLMVTSMQLSAAFFKKFAHLFPEETVSDSGTVSPAAAIAVALAAIRAKRG